MPSFGVSRDPRLQPTKRRKPTEGAAQVLTSERPARQSHRGTSGGTAVPIQALESQGACDITKRTRPGRAFQISAAEMTMTNAATQKFT